jgi:hypothetical protein
LDFTEAEFSSAQVTVELAVTGGSVDLLVPSATTVVTTAVTTIGGQVVERRQRPVGGPGEPVLVLTGKVRAGEVRIRRPRFGPALLRFSVALGLRAAEQVARRLP